MFLYRSESGKLEKYGFQVPGPFGIDYVVKFWISEVENKDFTYLLDWCNDNISWENNNDENVMWKKYNCFSIQHPTIEQLKKDIHNEYLNFMKELGEEPEDIYINGWFNPYQKGQGQRIHYHNMSDSSYLTGVVTLTKSNTSTDFMVPAPPGIDPDHRQPMWDCVKIKNSPGSLVFFPQWTYHYVELLTEETKRVTIGFDLFTKRGMEYIEKNNDKDHMYRRAIKLSD